MKVIVVRHAHRADVADPNWVKTSPAPWDPPLSAQGVADAAALAKEVRTALGGDTGPVLVYASPFWRCVETALPLVAALDGRLRLASVFGEWLTSDYFAHGLPPSDDHAGLAARAYGQIIARGDGSAARTDFTWDVRALGGAGAFEETWAEMHERVRGGVDRLVARTRESADAPAAIVLVTHGSVCNSALSRLRGTPQLEEIALASFAEVDV